MKEFPLPFGMSCALTDQLELTGNNKRFGEPSFFLISTNVFYQGSEPRHTEWGDQIWLNIIEFSWSSNLDCCCIFVSDALEHAEIILGVLKVG